MTDLVRLIHSGSDLQRAHMIIVRLIEEPSIDGRNRDIMETALLADYQRPFRARAEESDSLDVDQLDLKDGQLELHALLLQRADQYANRRAQQGGPVKFGEAAPLSGLDLEAVRDLIFQLRQAVAKAAYPDARDDPKLLQLLVGPIRPLEG